MDKEALRQRLMVTFLGELEEHVRALNRDAIALERTPGDDGALLTSLFRTAHSLKGAARSVNVRPIEAACHRLETLLGHARDAGQPLAPETLQLLLTTADAFADAGDRLRAHEDVAVGPLRGVLRRLDEAGQQPPGAAAPSPPPATTTAATPPPVPDAFVRVPAAKLDSLLASSSELLIALRRLAAEQQAGARLHDALRRWRSEWLQLERPLRKALAVHGPLLPRRALLALDRTRDQLHDIEHLVGLLSSRMSAETHGTERAAATVEDEIRTLRMFPFSHACEGLERAVRDLTRGSAKQVNVVVEGGDVELGRFVLESLRDPLLHLVRNAVDHGIETADERRAAGKPPLATVTVSAALRGNVVEITVADDGRGLDIAAIRELARRKQIAAPDDDGDAARLIFLPGFSTARVLTEVSGRGVGLEVVKHRVESLHGHVDVASSPAGGLRVVLTVPLTLITIRALLVRVAGHVYAIPVTSVRRLARVGAADIASVRGREVLLSEGAPIPIATLAAILHLDGAAPRFSHLKAPLVVMTSGAAQVAVIVDELITEDEVLVKALGARLRHVRHVAGATILASGEVALILNAAGVVQSALTAAPPRALAALQEPTPAARRRLLVVDDSVTTRSLQRSILEGAGYEVMVAGDGSDAWQLLQDAGADLVVADVEMPRMDGFALCEAIRRSTRFRDLPIVLVTALQNDADRKRGLDAGADAYLSKAGFDQRVLLDTVAQLL
jgi:two-component system, chemotaxis family, sensor kinase CheA